MIELGFDPTRVIISGIPVHPVFAQKKDKGQMRIKHNLAPNLTTILICASGLGESSINEILNELPELLTACQVIIACGANSSLYKKLQAFAENMTSKGFTHCHVLKFTAEIDEYMSASDLIVGKPGGLTSAEALVKGLIFVIVNPIPGQEERNADHLLEEGVAIRCNNLPVLSCKIDRLLADQGRLETMRKNALAMARPHAADKIVSEVMALIQSDESVRILTAHVCDGATY